MTEEVAITAKGENRAERGLSSLTQKQRSKQKGSTDWSGLYGRFIEASFCLLWSKCKIGYLDPRTSNTSNHQCFDHLDTMQSGGLYTLQTLSLQNTILRQNFPPPCAAQMHHRIIRENTDDTPTQPLMTNRTDPLIIDDHSPVPSGVILGQPVSQ